jgi:hypothetical protein
VSPKVGVMLPTFTTSPRPAFEAAAAAERGGLDGIFAFDHLWPMGSPGRPALWSFGMLGAVAARTSRVTIGTLVARVDLLPEVEVVRMFETLGAIAGKERVIAALGAGDSLSAAENHAYGYPRLSAADRLAMIGRVADRVRAAGIQTWIGGTSRAVSAAVTDHADFQNFWGVDAQGIADHGNVPRTWAGQVLIGRDDEELESLRTQFGDRPGLVAGTVSGVAAHFRELGSAGAAWCVGAPLDYIVQPARAVETVCLVAEAVN